MVCGNGFVYHVTPHIGEHVIPGKPGRHRVAMISDLHFGSKFCNKKRMIAFLKEAWKQGARVCVVVGDVLDGNKSVLLPEQSSTTFDAQLAELRAFMKKAPAFEFVAIDGNHDGYFSASAGFTSGQLVANDLREHGVDWTFLGVCLGRARIHGARWHLWHPHGGASTRNAVRRILNERAEALQERTDILVMGHFHKFASLPIYPEGIHGVCCPTFQEKGSEFSNRMTRPWDIGGVIVAYNVARNGHVSEVSAEIV